MITSSYQGDCGTDKELDLTLAGKEGLVRDVAMR